MEKKGNLLGSKIDVKKNRFWIDSYKPILSKETGRQAFLFRNKKKTKTSEGNYLGAGESYLDRVERCSPKIDNWVNTLSKIRAIIYFQNTD